MYLPSNKGMITSMFEEDKAMISNHLGRNPVNGGNPPKDSSSKIKAPETPADNDVNFINWVGVLVERELSRINIGVIIKV